MLDRKYNTAMPVVSDTKSLLKELNSKYCPLYDLKMNSLIEDIDVKFSLAEVTKAEKVEHAIRQEKLREQQAKEKKQKARDLQNEIDRRRTIFEKQRAKNLQEARELREEKMQTQFQMTLVDDSVDGFGYAFDATQINMVAEKTLHNKYGTHMSPLTQEKQAKVVHMQQARLTHFGSDNLPEAKETFNKDG